MVIIPINKRSIRKNPDAGRTSFTFDGQKWIEVFSEIPLPDKFYKYLYLTGADIVNGEYRNCRYTNSGIVDAELVEELSKIARIDFYHSPRHFQTATQPSYLFKYINKKVECSNCGHKIGVLNIPTNDYGDYPSDECPKCHELNTFDYRMQKLSEIKSQ